MRKGLAPIIWILLSIIIGFIIVYVLITIFSTNVSDVSTIATESLTKTGTGLGEMIDKLK